MLANRRFFLKCLWERAESKDFGSFSETDGLLDPDLIEKWQLFTCRRNPTKVILELKQCKDIMSLLVNKENWIRLNLSQSSVPWCTLRKLLYQKDLWLSNRFIHSFRMSYETISINLNNRIAWSVLMWVTFKGFFLKIF